MEKILEKLDSYNILNNLLPGIVLNFLLERIIGVKIVEGNIIEDLFVFYFMGMVVSRFGSLVIEPICKKIKWVKYADYGEFVKASRKDEKVNVLSVCIVVLIAKVYLILISKIRAFSTITDILILVIITILFAVAYKKTN